MTKTHNFVNLGLRFKLPKNLKSRPLEALNAYTRTYRKSGKKVDVFRSVDLWQREQNLSYFFSDDCSVAFYQAKTILPEESISLFFTKDQFDSLMINTGNTQWNTEKEKQWVTQYNSHASFIKPLKNKKFSANLYRLSDSDADAYGFMITSVKYPKERFFLRFTITKSKISEKKMLKFAGNLFKSLAIISRKEKEIIAVNKTSFKNKKGNRSKEFLKSRDKVINNIKGIKGWWYAESKNYILVANLAGSNKSIGALVLKNIEIIRSAFEVLYPPRKKITEISVIRVFNTRKGYVNYAGNEGSAGRWSPMQKELIVSPSSYDGKRLRPETILDTVYHEAFHQYIFYAIGNIAPLSWYNEGYGDFFSGAKISSKSIKINEASRAYTIDDTIGNMDIARLTGYLSALLKMTQAQYYESGKILHNYAYGWAIVYYLKKGTKSKKNPYRNILKLYTEEILASGNNDKAMKIAWEGVDMKKFAVKFKKFWMSDRKRKSAVKYRLIKKLLVKAAKKKKKL